MKRYFYIDESPIYSGKYLIRLNHDEMVFPTGTRGSFNVFISRVVNLTYPEFLRYVRDVLGAELVGKGHKYVIPYFERSNELTMFVKLLNKRMEYIMKEQESPYEYFRKEDGTVDRIPFYPEEEVNEDNKE